MNNSKSGLKFLVTTFLPVVIGLVLYAPTPAVAQAPQTERERAFELYAAGNFVAALPLLEKVAKATPDDPTVLSRLGFSLFATSTSEKDPASRQKIRERARQVLLKSQSLGDDSNLTKITLDGLSQPDSTAAPFSSTQAAENEIRKGEEAFVHGDMDAALAAYKHAFELDPHLYEAALYAGDVEFKKAHSSADARFRNEHFDLAGGWFARAIAVDADRETAYRYWGDALDAQGKSAEARDRFVDAIVAEPYSRRSYVGLTQWAERHNIPLGHPRIDIPTSVTSKKPGEINITLDDLALKGSDNDGSAAWMMYGIVRAAWMDKKDGGRSEKFARAYPNEVAYRHSLQEEADALRTVLESVQTQSKEKRIKKLAPSLEALTKLKDAGFIESYILFVKPDEGIGRDYAAYRKQNRDKLKQYWMKFVIGVSASGASDGPSS